ncbi:MAG: helicase-associated domain-containing protein [Ilumatobacteraceae bacterium]
MATRVDVTRLADHLVVLGLAPPDGPVGLGALARTVLTEPDSLHALLPDQDRTFVVQADLSVIAPPALDPVVRARLDRLCVAESSGSVNVLRLDRTRIAAEMASGATAESLLEFVTAHSSVPIAPVVAQVFADVERQRGGLTARGAATVVTADDVLGLAAAVKVRATRLTCSPPRWRSATCRSTRCSVRCARPASLRAPTPIRCRPATSSTACRPRRECVRFPPCSTRRPPTSKHCWRPGDRSHQPPHRAERPDGDARARQPAPTRPERHSPASASSRRRPSTSTRIASPHCRCGTQRWPA